MFIYSDIKNAKRTALIKRFASLPTPQHALHDRPRSPEFKHPTTSDECLPIFHQKTEYLQEVILQGARPNSLPLI